MREIIGHINKVFENRMRLSIMSLLMIHEKMDFNSLKEQMHITDGNLATHINMLDKYKYLAVKKSFVGKKTNTSYVATAAGKKAFNDHLDALEQVLKSHR